MRLAFLASNSGSSMRAIIAAIESGQLDAVPVLAVSNRRDAPALAFAHAHGVPTVCIPTLKDPQSADVRLSEALATAAADVVVLSGYLRKLGPRTLQAYAGRILNIHPALLPAFGGEGMYGRRVHEAVVAAKVAVSGATVHLVDEEYDHGPIVAQVEVPVWPGDGPDLVESRVMAAEPALFVRTLQQIALGVVELPALRRSARIE
ncbi:MAG TPA: phosphoribosylglycinamide formyltransferase [Caulobacteraceae bacterium]|jgi:phosphoribosylglycinamide formyltransferase-1|nr:phosphoribosylglycinamide formyltransferase [Caulobacteraceae bacterium]